MSHVYVLVEHDAGQLAPVTAELITAARPLGAVSAVVVGGHAEELAPELEKFGAVQVVNATAADYDARLITPEVDALHALGQANPAPIIIAADRKGNEIAGRLGARLASGVLANVSAIAEDRSANLSIFGGSTEVTASAHGNCPVYTVQPGAVEPSEAPAQAQVVPMPLPAATERDVQVVGFTPAVKSARPELGTAKTVVAGGRGVGNEFAGVVEPLAIAAPLASQHF